MEKKISIYFLLFFQWLEMKKKKQMKKKKNLGRTIFGLLPNLYCEKKNLYCKIMHCIVTERWLAWEEGVLQYTLLG